LPHLSVSLLGPFRATVDDRPLAGFRSSKVRALLAYLAAEPEQLHPRTVVAGLLWPDLPDQAAAANLRNALWNLRRVGREADGSSDLIVTTAGGLQLNPAAGISVDLTTFLELTSGNLHVVPGEASGPAVVRLEEAAALYRGDFLAGLTVDSAPFEQWVLLRREQIRQRLAGALRYLTAALEHSGDRERALASARRHLEIDPWDEEAHRCVMRLFALTGRRSAALAQYETCRQLLAEDLGIQPSAETQALAAAIQEGTFEEPAATWRLAGREGPAQLPVPTTRLFGRRAEMAAIGALLDGPARLVTIVGPGGIGKTRLALEIAGQHRTRFADGVAYVDLAPYASDAAVVPAMLEALNAPIERYGRVDPQVQLLDALRDRSALLLLDNFEGVLAAAPLLGAMMQAAPGVKLLVTSRAPLGLEAEHLFHLHGLEYSAWQTAEEAEHVPAVALFMEFARRARPSFALQADDLIPLRLLLQQVSGMPLALILAAAWVNVLGLAELTVEIGCSLDILQVQHRDVPERQRSMRAIFRATWERLSGRERAVCSALSVFHGGFTLDAARAVAQATPRDLLPLINCSLLSRSAAGRFTIHELLRQFAREELARSPEQQAGALERHAAYYCRFLQQREAAVKGAAVAQAVAQIGADFDNALAAVDWAAQNGRVDLLEQADVLNYYAIRQGRRMEAAAMSHKVAEKLKRLAPPLGHHVTANYLTADALFTAGAGIPGAQEALAEALEHLAEAAKQGDDIRYDEGRTLMILGQVLMREEPGRARPVLERSLRLLQEAGADYEAANVCGDLAFSYEVEADYRMAHSYAMRSLRMWEIIGDPIWIEDTRVQLAWLKLKLGQPEQATAEIRDAAARFEADGNDYFAAKAHLALGAALVTAGRFEQALVFIDQNLAYFSRQQGRAAVTAGLAEWCWAALHLGRYADVARESRQLLVAYRQVQQKTGVPRAAFLEGCAALALGQADEARPLLQASVRGSRDFGQQEQLGLALAVLGWAAQASGAWSTAAHELCEALRVALDRRLTLVAGVALPAAAVVLVNHGQKEQALEIYGLAGRDPLIARSRWITDLAGARLEEAAKELPEEVAAAAQVRGRILDLWKCVGELPQLLERAVLEGEARTAG
jgi:DNA-binding SARP family transcriptional activator/predicted ATPase